MKAPEFCLLALFLCACRAADPCASAPPTTRASEDPTPLVGDPWQLSEPALVGLDAAELAKAAAYSQSIGGQCLLVYKDGRLVFEQYYNGASETSQQKSWSIAKSVTSTLLGIALRRDELRCVEQPVADFVPAWSDGKRDAIQLRHLLSHSSGLAFDAYSDAIYAITSGDLTAEALILPSAAPPDTTFAYSQAAVQVLGAVLERAVGEDLETYARRHLWGPLGASATLSWDRDPAGHVPMFDGLHVSCRDLLRLGVLYLHDGAWNGRPLLPPEYVSDATHSSQSVNRAVGYLWWLNGQTPALAAPQQALPGWLLPEAPADLYSATGLGQNFVDVVPSTHTVYVHMRPAPQDMPNAMQTDLLKALFDDGLQIEHREILRRLGAAENQ